MVAALWMGSRRAFSLCVDCRVAFGMEMINRCPMCCSAKRRACTGLPSVARPRSWRCCWKPRRPSLHISARCVHPMKHLNGKLKNGFSWRLSNVAETCSATTHVCVFGYEYVFLCVYECIYVCVCVYVSVCACMFLFMCV